MEQSDLIATEQRLKSMKNSNMDLDDIYNLISYMYSNKCSKDKIKKVLTNIFSHSFPNSLTTIAHILTCEGDYSLAQDYISLGLKNAQKDELYFLKAVCECKLQHYHNCLKTIEKLDSEEYADVIEELSHYCNMKLNNSAI